MTESLPLVSILIPVYNVELYLPDCINSVINQTYKNIEIILIDDGSSDNCPKMCDEWSKKDNRINVIHKKNGGAADARNTAINQSNGDYLCFIDGDDIVHNQYIELLINPILNNSRYFISCCNYLEFENKETLKSQIEVIDNYKEKEYKEILSSIVSVAPWGKIIHKSLFDNITFPVGKLNEDEYIMYKIFSKSTSIVYLDKKLYFYRLQDKSLTHTKTAKNYLDLIEARKERVLFFKNYSDKFYYEYSIVLLIGDYINFVNNIKKYNFDKNIGFELKQFIKQQDIKSMSLITKLRYFGGIYIPKIYYNAVHIYLELKKR